MTFATLRLLARGTGRPGRVGPRFRRFALAIRVPRVRLARHAPPARLGDPLEGRELGLQARRSPMAGCSRRTSTRPSRLRPSRWTAQATRVPPAAGASSQRRSPTMAGPPIADPEAALGPAPPGSRPRHRNGTGPSRSRRGAPGAGGRPVGPRRRGGQDGVRRGTRAASWSASQTAAGGASTNRRRSTASRGSRGMERPAAMGPIIAPRARRPSRARPPGSGQANAKRSGSAAAQGLPRPYRIYARRHVGDRPEDRLDAAPRRRGDHRAGGHRRRSACAAAGWRQIESGAPSWSDEPRRGGRPGSPSPGRPRRQPASSAQPRS